MKISIPDNVEMDVSRLSDYVMDHYSEYNKSGLFVGDIYVSKGRYGNREDMRKRAKIKMYEMFKDYYTMLGWFISNLLVERQIKNEQH